MENKLRKVVGMIAVIVAVCACRNERGQELRGVVREVSVDGLTVVTSAGKTFRVDRTRADWKAEDEILPGDTVRVYYRKEADEKNIRATGITVEPGRRTGEMRRPEKNGREVASTKGTPDGWYLEQEDGSLGRRIAVPRDFAALQLDSFVSPEGEVRYALVGSLKKGKKAVWADATEAAIGKYIAFVFEGNIIVRPSPNQRLESGNFSICPGRQNAMGMRRMFRILREEMDAGEDERNAEGETAG